MTKKKHPHTREERIKLGELHSEKKKTKSARARIKDQIRDEETKDDLKAYTGNPD